MLLVCAIYCYCFNTGKYKNENEHCLKQTVMNLSVDSTRHDYDTSQSMSVFVPNSVMWICSDDNLLLSEMNE
jgi:hypothetical protein